MKIAFLTDGKSPVPATKGGAVENLIEDLLDENEKSVNMQFDVLGIYEDEAYKKSKRYSNTRFHFVKNPKIICLFDKIIYWVAKKILKKSNLISYRYIFQRLYVMSRYPSILLREDYDRIVIVTNSTLFFVLKNKRVANKYKDKVIYYLHNEVRTFFRCEKEVGSIRSLIGVSQFVNREFRKKIPTIKSKQCYVLKNGIDTYKFTKNDFEKNFKIKKELGIQDEDFIIIFAGRLVREKGALETIKAIKKCKDNDMKLLVVGSGFYSSDIVDNYMIELQKEAEDIKDKIIFTGYIDYEDMPSIYHIGDVAVLPSIWDEPAGMTMVEAVISGLPLITTNSGGIPEYISCQSAFILDRNEKLVDRIAELLIEIKDNYKMKEKALGGIQSMMKELNLENYYRRFCEICKK